MSTPQFPDALVARAAEALEAKYGYGSQDGELLARAVLLAVGPELQAVERRGAEVGWQLAHDDLCDMGQFCSRHQPINAEAQRPRLDAALQAARADRLAPAPHEFTEDVDDGSMCVCGIPALTHDEVMQRHLDPAPANAKEAGQ